MQLNFLKSKIHRARVTHAEVEYEGSLAIDSELLNVAGIAEYEQLHVYNLSNGERFITYAIAAHKGSRIISANGGAAYKANPDDRIIICTYCQIDASRIKQHKPKLVYLDSANRITRVTNEIPVQAA